MQTLQYISVLGASSDGAIVFEVETFNLTDNQTYSISASGILDTDSEKAIAAKIQDAFNLVLTPFDGSMTYPNTAKELGFVVSRTDHVVCISAQANFDLTVVSNPGVATIKVNTVPTPITIAEADAIADSMGTPLENDDGTDLSVAAKATLLELISIKLLSILRNNIVSSYYFEEQVGEGTEALTLSNGPVQNWRNPQVKLPFTVFINLSTISSDLFNLEGRELFYSLAQNLISAYEPFDRGAQILIAYLAGEYTIPAVLKSVIIDFWSTGVYTSSGSEYSEIAGGSSKFKYVSNPKLVKEIIAPLRKYMQ